jgi:hypothetical protein
MGTMNETTNISFTRSLPASARFQPGPGVYGVKVNGQYIGVVEQFRASTDVMSGRIRVGRTERTAWKAFDVAGRRVAWDFTTRLDAGVELRRRALAPAPAKPDPIVAIMQRNLAQAKADRAKLDARIANLEAKLAAK